VASSRFVTGVEGIAVKFGESAVKQIGVRLWQRMRPDTSRTALIRDADHLADAVNRREKTLLDQLRGGRNMIIDDLEFRAELRLRLAAGDAAGVLKDIGPYFRQQKTRRLVVLGEPGAGKTVTVVHLVLDQLDHRKTLTHEVRADEPVPVRVNAAGWDGSADFTSWLAQQLAIDYELNPRVARAMIKDDRILTVLDGLDEMDPPDAKPVLACAALERLNKSPWQNRAVVVACRSRVYKAIRELRPDAGLQFATTVTLQPLTAEDIYFYLEQYRDGLDGVKEAEWAPVTDQLDQADGVLATALRTPWLLSLAATALKRGGHETAIELAACRDTAQIRERLFESLIPAAVGTIPEEDDSTPTYTEENVRRWLRALAQYLERRRSEHSGGTQIALDQIWAIAGARRCRILHGLATGLAAGLATGLAAGLAIGLLFGLAVGLATGTAGPGRGLLLFRLLFGLLFGFAVGLTILLEVGLAYTLAVGLTVGLTAGPAVALAVGRSSSAGRLAWRVPGRSRWRRGLAVGLAVGLTVGLAYALAFGLVIGLAAGTAVGLAAGLAVGLAFGLWMGLETNSADRLALGQDAQQIIRDDLARGLVGGLTVGLTAGLTAGIVTGRAAGLTAGIVIGLVVGLVVGFVIGLTAGLAAGRYATASFIFVLTGIFPPRPAQFLEWARNTGLLRVTGIAYQCRHDSYQQWLTDRAPQQQSDLPTPSPPD
jgi:hypothetical protein